MALSKTALRVLKNATQREHGNICPIGGVYAGAETVLLRSLQAKGLIYDADKSPFITQKGRDAIRGEK